jgi:hypothetical protein
MGSTHNLAGSRSDTHTHAHYALESTSVNKDRNLKVHSEHFLRNFPSTFGVHPTGIFPPQIPLQNWQVFHFSKQSTFFFFFFMFSFDNH